MSLPRDSSSSCNEIVQNAIERTQRIIRDESLIPWMLHARDSEFEPPPCKDSMKYIASVDISGALGGYQARLKPSQVDESYSISVTKSGSVQIQAMSSVGAIRALDTFTQLFYRHSQVDEYLYTNLVPLEIRDKPRFKHRGLNLDVARSWYSVQDILRTIEIMAWNKLNVLHLHVTDSQSWPIEIPALPDLARKGAFHQGLFYSPRDIERIQTYAAARGIEVVFEVDLPGHTASVGLAYPNLIAAHDMQPDWMTYAAEPPSGQLKLNSTNVTTFVRTVLDDLLPRLGPHSTSFHTGGDEVNANAYLLDETVRSNDPKVLKPLLQKFVDDVHDRVRANGLTPLVWEEMLLDWNLTLGKDVIVQSWRSSEAIREIVERGYQVIAGNYQFWVRCSLPLPYVYVLS